MQVIPAAVGHRLLDEMAAVAGRIDRHIMAAPADTALQNRFQRRKVIIVGREAQIVNKEDEFQRIVRQLVHQGGNLVKLVLLNLDQPQAVRRKLVGNGFDRAGFAGAGIAVQQHIVRGAALQQGAGVGDDLLPLLLIAGQLAQPLRVGVAHRHQTAVLQCKHMVAGKHTVALASGRRAARLIGRAVIRIRRGLPAGQKRRRAGEHLVQRGAPQLLQKVQLIGQRLFQHRAGILPGRHTQAEVFLLQHGIQQGIRPVRAAGKQLRLQRGHCAGQGGIVRRQRSTQRAERLGREQPAKHHKPVQTS